MSKTKVSNCKSNTKELKTLRTWLETWNTEHENLRQGTLEQAEDDAQAIQQQTDEDKGLKYTDG